MGITGLSALSFKTPRLSVRAISKSDALLASELRPILTESVLAHLPSHLQRVTTETDWINARMGESTVLAVRADADSLIGLALLATFENDVHLGYLLGPDAWGRGYASELVQGLLPALSEIDVNRVLAGVERGNDASARVLEKSGFGAPSLDASGTAQYIWRA